MRADTPCRMDYACYVNPPEDRTCPECGEELPKHYYGDLCPDCEAKEDSDDVPDA